MRCGPGTRIGWVDARSSTHLLSTLEPVWFHEALYQPGQNCGNCDPVRPPYGVLHGRGFYMTGGSGTQAQSGGESVYPAVEAGEPTGEAVYRTDGAVYGPASVLIKREDNRAVS